MPRPVVIQTEHLDPDAAAWLAERCELIVCPSEDSRFEGHLARAEGLVIRTYTRVDGDLLAKAPRLRAVARAGVGLDNVDQHACAARGVKVFSTPGANTHAVVEFVFALISDALRPRVFLDRALSPVDWKRVRSELIAPRELSGLTLGILGLGRVGSGVARVGSALGMRVLYRDILDIPQDLRFGAQPVGFEALMRESDILTIHPDGRPENRGIMDARAFSLMKPDVLFINTARGFLVDNHALSSFMIGHPGAAAMLDVHDPEPFGDDYPLLEIANVHLSPHLAAATRTAHSNMSWVVRDLWAHIEATLRVNLPKA